MKHFILSAALLACAIVPAAAQTPDWSAPQAGDLALITDCIATHDASPEEYDVRRCIGVVSQACEMGAGVGGGETTAGMTLCANRETTAWSALIDQHAATLRARESPTQIAVLERVLSQGEAWARERCAYDASMFEGGSMVIALAALCTRDTTAERALDLQRRLTHYDNL